MKNIVLAFAFLACVQVTSAQTFVSDCISATGVTSSTSVACASTINIAAGNTIVVALVGANANSATISDGADTFTPLATCFLNGTVGSTQFFYATNAAANATATITGTYSLAATYRVLWAIQISGANTLDAGPACSSGTATSTATSAVFSTVNANEILITAASVGFAGTLFYTPGVGYTLGAGAPDGDFQGQYEIVTSTQSSVTGSMTYGTTAPNNVGEITLYQTNAAPQIGLIF